MESDTQRRTKTRYYYGLAENVAANLNTLIMDNAEYGDKTMKSQRLLADRLGVAPTAVNRWMSGKYLPQSDQLYAVAALFNTTVDWLMKPHKFGDDIHPASQTYIEAFYMCKGLMDLGVYKKDACQDEFLIFLLKSHYHALHSQITQKRFREYMAGLLRDYDVPLLPFSLTSRYEDSVKIMGDPDEKIAHAQILRMMTKFSRLVNKDDAADKTNMLLSADNGEHIDFIQWLKARQSNDQS